MTEFTAPPDDEPALSLRSLPTTRVRNVWGPTGRLRSREALVGPLARLHEKGDMPVQLDGSTRRGAIGRDVHEVAPMRIRL